MDIPPATDVVHRISGAKVKIIIDIERNGTVKKHNDAADFLRNQQGWHWCARIASDTEACEKQSLWDLNRAKNAQSVT